MYRLRSLNTETGGLAETEIPLTLEEPVCSVRLRALPGATAIHLAVAAGDGVTLRAEVPSDEEENVLVRFELDENGRLAATSPGRHVLTLAPDERYGAPLPIRLAPPGSPLDLALVIDGTARSWSRDGSRPLLADPEVWSSRVGQLVELAESLGREHSDPRLAVVAFGDDPLPGTRAPDLSPRYLLHPAPPEIGFRSADGGELRDLLLAIPPTSGGDFVDALADALEACRTRLLWRPEARKLLVLVGDSPGHSILHPPPVGGDARVRELDVDREALLLHQEGVEIVTLYLEPATEETSGLDWKHELVELARAQYRRLASRPATAFTASGFDPARAVETVLNQTGLLGREACWAGRIELGEHF